MIACAVSKASLPILKTQTFRLRSTPVASAKTFGRPSNTNPTTPSGALWDSIDQPSCTTVSRATLDDATVSQIRSASIMSCRIESLSTKRVIDLPVALAVATSTSLAARIALNTSSSSSLSANRE